MDKLFVVVRSDLPIGDQMAQTGHAIAEYVLYGDQLWHNETLVCLVSGKYGLNVICLRLRTYMIPYVEWREPDLDNHVTAIAAFTDEKHFHGLKKFGE